MADCLTSRCELSPCTFACFAVCNCCHRSICMMHLSEHLLQTLNASLGRISDEIMTQMNQISTLNVPFLTILEQWRIDCQRAVDVFCNDKRQKFLTNRASELNFLRMKVNELISTRQLTQTDLSSIQTSLYSMQQEFHENRYVFHPLIIHECQVARNAQCVLPFRIPQHQIELTDCSYAVFAANEKHLLVHREPTLCLLDRQLNTLKETSWPLDDIRDMCWSSSLNHFIVVNSTYICVIDESTMILKSCLSSETIHWMRVTCSDTRIFLSTEGVGSSIFEYSFVLSSILFVKEWKTPITCANNEWIEDMKYNDDCFGLVIGCCASNKSRLELRLAVTLECRWSIQLEDVHSSYSVRCCPVFDRQWIVVAFRNSQVFHISVDGTLINVDKQYRSPSNVCRIGNDLVAIWDQKSVYLHSLF